MATKTLAKLSERTPSVFDDFFKPWNEWFDTGSWGKTMNIPAINIKEEKDGYMVSLAAPGMKKEDFEINVDGNTLKISSEKEEEKADKDSRYTRKEYSFSSFERSLMLPDEVDKDNIEAHYEDGLLKLGLPKKEEARGLTVSKQIAVK